MAKLDLGDVRNLPKLIHSPQAFTALGPRQTDSESRFAVRGPDYQLWSGAAGTGGEAGVLTETGKVAGGISQPQCWDTRSLEEKKEVFADFCGVDTPPWAVSSCRCESLQVELGRDPRPLG